MRDRKQPCVSRNRQGIIDVLRLDICLKTDVSGIDLADGFLETLFEGTADSHDLADGLHGGTDPTVNLRREFCEIPLWNFGYDVIEGRLKTRSCSLCNCIRHLRQCVTESDLGGCVRERVPSRLGCEGAAAWVRGKARREEA